MISSSDEDVAQSASKRLLERPCIPFQIEPKDDDWHMLCGEGDRLKQAMLSRKKLSKLAATGKCSWFSLWFIFILWMPVIVLFSFTIIDPWAAFFTIGMFVLSVCLLVIILTIFYFRKYDAPVIIRTIFWQECMVLFAFVMGFGVSYNGLVLKGTNFETQYDVWGLISIAHNSLEASIIKFLRAAKNDKRELMRRIVTLYYYFICVFHQSYNVTASINFIDTMKWIKRIQPLINDLYKYGEYTFVVDIDAFGTSKCHCINIRDLDPLALDMIINEDQLGLRRMFMRKDINYINNEQDHYYRIARMPVQYVQYVWPLILGVCMCGNVAFQAWFIHQMFEVEMCVAAIVVQCVFLVIAVAYVMTKRAWMVNNGWNFRILRNPTVFAAISCFTNSEIEAQINKLYNEFNERKQLLAVLSDVRDEKPEYGLNHYIIDVIVNLTVDETKNIQQLTSKKRHRLIGRSSYVWKYVVKHSGSSTAMIEAYSHLMNERNKALICDDIV